MNFLQNVLPRWMVTALLLATASSGCVKRTEVVAVLPDGHVEMVVMLHGDVEDIQGSEGQLANDPPPSAENGWKVTTKLEEKNTIKVGEKKQDSGEKEMTLVATQSFAPGQPLPTTYATPNTPLADAAKKFYTNVKIEKNQEGTLYHFRRTYPSRVWAPFEYHSRRILETDEIKKLMESKPDELTHDDRKTIASSLVAVGIEQQVELLHLAIDRTKGRISQMAQLKAIGCIREIAEDDQLRAQVVSLLIDGEGVDAGSLEEDLANRITKCVREALVDAGTSQTDITLAMSKLDATRLEFAVTRDLGDESWNVMLALPGKIIAHDSQNTPEAIDPADLDEPDADKNQLDKAMRTLSDKMKPFAAEPGFETYSWTFDAKALRDRDVVLMATSFVPNK